MEIPDGESALPLNLDVLQQLGPLPDLNLFGQVQLQPGLIQGGRRAKGVTQGERKKAWLPAACQIHFEVPISS